MVSEGHSESFFGKDPEFDWIVDSSVDGLFIALPGGKSVEQFHLTGAHHGHILKLLPDLSLCDHFSPGEKAAPFSASARTLSPMVSDALLVKVREITPDVLSNHVDRYSGVKNLNAQTTGLKVKSRHILHEHNKIVTNALVSDLSASLGPDATVKLHSFVHESQLLHNVEGEIQGSDPDLNTEVVLITAHFDSTANSDDNYDPERDAAPGADDDASGVAALLAIAEVFGKTAAMNKPKRSIRFVLFNGEEHGMVGSKAYAHDQAASNTPIVGVYQMDMIGYNKVPPRTSEIHAGPNRMGTDQRPG